jgi:hypothetical protein
MDDNQFADAAVGEEYADAAYVVPWSNALMRVPRAKLDDPARTDGHLGWPVRDLAEREDGQIWQSPVAYLPDISVMHCPLEHREYDNDRWRTETYDGLPVNDWYYDIQGTYGLNTRMTSWYYVFRGNLAVPAECFMFADSWMYGFDHVWETDLWFSPRHGANGDVVNIMFHDGHTEGRRFAPPIDEIPTADSLPIYAESPPWWPGNPSSEWGEYGN